VKYGNEWGGWCSNPILDPYGFGMWRTIRQGWPSVSSHILSEVGDGTRVKFWQDRWSGRVLLLFATSLFWICHNKEGKCGGFNAVHQWGSSLGSTLCTGHTRLGIGVHYDFHGYHLWF